MSGLGGGEAPGPVGSVLVGRGPGPGTREWASGIASVGRDLEPLRVRGLGVWLCAVRSEIFLGRWVKARRVGLMER